MHFPWYLDCPGTGHKLEYRTNKYPLKIDETKANEALSNTSVEAKKSMNHCITEATNINELVEKEPWLSSSKLVVKPDMLFGKRGKSGIVALNLRLGSS
ncbi:ATP-citrate synthase alpha chain protein 1 [Orobanche minor]